MHRYGHIGVALLAYAPIGGVAIALGLEKLALIGGITAVSVSTLPDVDEYLPSISHRGPTHTVWFVVASAGLFGCIGVASGLHLSMQRPLHLGVLIFVSSALSLGSHVLADALTPDGVSPFAPVRVKHYSFDYTASANVTVNRLLLALGVVVTVIATLAGIAVARLAAS